MNPIYQTYRRQVVPTIIKIQQTFTQVSRNSMFLAISIFDLCLKNLSSSNQSPFWTSSQVTPLSIALLLLSCKFQGDYHPSFKQLIENLKPTAYLSSLNFKQQIFQFQQLILSKIDFLIPTTTAYQVLDSIICNDQLRNNQTRKNIARTLKIMLTALLLTYQLSFDPSLGQKFHQITNKTSSKIDSKARTLYYKCIRTLQYQQQQKKLISAAVH